MCGFFDLNIFEIATYSFLLSLKRFDLHLRYSTISPFPTPTHGSFENVLKLERPRTIKTHLSYDMLPKQISQKGAKVFIIMFEVMITLNKFTFF